MIEFFPGILTIVIVIFFLGGVLGLNLENVLLASGWAIALALYGIWKKGQIWVEW